MIQKILAEYVGKCISEDMKKMEIKERLLAVGWTEDEVEAAYAEALKISGIPIPNEKNRGVYAKKSSALEITLNLFSFILLGIMAAALGSLFFEVINKYFPDPLSLENTVASSGSIHYAMSALIIAFPMYFFAMRIWFGKFREDEGKLESEITKWVTYLVLLGVSMTFVGDLIATLFTFLQGEMSVRFFLKALTIFAIAGGAFGFYFLERKKVQYRQNISRNVFVNFGWGFFGVIVFGIALGFLAAGSPETERKRTFDVRRVEDLSNLSGCIDRFGEKYQRLPKDIAELETSGNSGYSCSANAKDPETGEEYEYRITTPFRMVGNVTEADYELCATFSLSSDETINGGNPGSFSYYPAGDSGQWKKHDSGRECRTRTTVVKSVTAKSE